MPSNEQPDFDEEFTKAVAEWRDKHRLREDDAVMLLVELFRIHQQHWDELRRREIPAFSEFRADIGKLADAARTGLLTAWDTSRTRPDSVGHMGRVVGDKSV